MPQTNSILNVLNITDTNISIADSRDEIVYKRGQKKHIKVLEGRLSYTLSKCPNCGFDRLIKNGARCTDVRLGSINGSEYHLKLWKQRYLCHSCKTTCGAHSNLVSPNQSMSHQIESLITPLAKRSLTIKAIAEIVGVSASTVSRKVYGDKPLPRRVRILPKNICMDEFRSANHLFSFIACDADTHRLMTLLPKRLSMDIIEHFQREYSLEERQQVQSVSIDLNANYQSVIRRLFPKAKIIVDRFHIIQLVGRSLDQVRISTLRSIENKHSREYKALKSQWRIFHLFDEELDSATVKYILGLNEYMTQQNLVDIGLDSNLVFKTVYETYQDIMRAVRTRDGKILKQTINNYSRTNTSMDTSITTLKQNISYLKNSCELPYSNGPLEGLIGKIKKLKHNCYGFRNLKHFFIRIRLIMA
ncbi:ISL3 family transposase [Companilactobacillus mishanensis]|uniref:ISL3 family transposase n=1 Tax=Companilactobacillus mishanensis TaxID=2486008 RepID=UPI00129734BF|nr:ISL3 family transposase [Companilactobacillus mishanensis]MQS90331.1 ISL3 family transposase [Companilactobacillus mishanensis]